MPGTRARMPGTLARLPGTPPSSSEVAEAEFPRRSVRARPSARAAAAAPDIGIRRTMCAPPPPHATFDHFAPISRHFRGNLGPWDRVGPWDSALSLASARPRVPTPPMGRGGFSGKRGTRSMESESPVRLHSVRLSELLRRLLFPSRTIGMSSEGAEAPSGSSCLTLCKVAARLMRELNCCFGSTVPLH